MAGTNNRILVKMLDRLFAAMVNGPSLNCRPHASRQRLDLTHIGRLGDLAPEEVLRGLLGSEQEVKLTARIPAPPRPIDDSQSERQQATSGERREPDAEPPLTEAERAARQAWSDQQTLLNKLRVIADDARTYEQDTGVNVLNVGFPLLSLPPTVLGARARGQTRRIIAPMAFIPAALIVKLGPVPSVLLACKGEGIDRIMPNTALLAWLEQQTGRDVAELFADERGAQPWREICEIVQQVARLMAIPAPELFLLPDTLGANEPGGATDAALPTAFRLNPAPRTEEIDATAAILPSAVVGLFPMANQGVLRDMQSMVAGEPLAGPVESFIQLDVSLEVPADHPQVRLDGPGRPRVFDDERLVAAADPCQLRAVRLARDCQGLVVHGPPGTGKSQTISNIIGDHLARGQRVLFVCDKRTALDVVAYRLEHMGLARLCALIHDPQRDQRELYRSVRDQLEALSDARSNPRAEHDLAKIDVELREVYAELAQYHAALVQPETADGQSFHDLVGEWLALSTDRPLAVDEDKLRGVTLAEWQQHAQEVREIAARAHGFDYAANPWVAAAGIDLIELVSRPVEVRTALETCMRQAERTDATADAAIPAFSGRWDWTEQAAARGRLAEQLRAVLEQVGVAVRNQWLPLDIAAVRRAHRKLIEAAPLIQSLRDGPLDAALAAQHNPPDLPTLADQLAALEAYLPVAGKWYGPLCVKRKAQAASVTARYGLPFAPATVRRLAQFLSRLRTRLVLKNLHDELLGYAPAPGLVDDERLERVFTEHLRLFELLDVVASSPALTGLAEAARAALTDAAAAARLIDGLQKSALRAEALAQFDATLAQSELFDADWRTALIAKLRNGETVTAEFVALQQTFDTLEDVLRLRQALGKLPATLNAAVQTTLAASAAPHDAVSLLHKAALSNEISRRLRNDPALAAVDARRIAGRFERYQQLQEQKKSLVRDLILHRWLSLQKERLLAGTGSRLNTLGADVRRRLTMRGERAMRLRQVIAVGAGIEGGDPLFDLRPVWMASPETVAQLFPRKPLFDVLVFDEASQCRLEEALPVLTRGQRVVIAGDPKQLPPTRFFETAIAVSEDDPIESDQQLFEIQQGEIEDLLGAALNLSIEQCYLDVHYRSRNADLIGFSNQQFYGSRLQPIPGHPSNRTRFAPLVLYRVNGVYQDRCNEIEADQIGRIVRDLLKRAEPPSIGVACFNLQQRDLIVEKLDALAVEDAEFGRRLAEARTRKGAGSFEGLFVKNLENVQGDERDHMIISTTYGPDAKGKFYRRFGPLGRAGGGRRLNVLVTRAREEVHLVTSIPPEIYRNIPPVPPGQTPGGGWLLFAYLAYAEQLAVLYERAKVLAPEPADRQRVEATPPPAVNVLPSKAPSRFAQALAQRLAEAHHVGSDVHWGNDGFCVDLALRHPSQPEDVTLGILCDTVRFAPSADPVEWDLFRTLIHESQGWQLHRIWTPHFFRDPDAALRSILRQAAAVAATTQPQDTLRVIESR